MGVKYLKTGKYGHHILMKEGAERDYFKRETAWLLQKESSC